MLLSYHAIVFFFFFFKCGTNTDGYTGWYQHNWQKTESLEVKTWRATSLRDPFPEGTKRRWKEAADRSAATLHTSERKVKNIRVQRSRSSSPCWAECVERSQDIAPDKKRFKHSLGVGVPEIELEPSNLPARNKKLCEHCESVGSFQKQMQRRLQKNWQSYRVKGTAISMMEKNDPISNFKGFVTFFLTVKISIRVWLPSFACADACVCVCVCAFDARHAAVFVVWEQDTAFCLIIDQRRCVAFRVLSAIIYWWNNNFNKTPSIHTHTHAHTHTHTHTHTPPSFTSWGQLRFFTNRRVLSWM